jgi:hypothetical protein
MMKIQNTDNTKCWREYEARGAHSLLVGMQNDTAPLEDSLGVSYKTKHSLLYNPVIMFLGIYSKESRIYVYIKTCTQIFAAAVFIIVKTGSNQYVLQ